MKNLLITILSFSTVAGFAQTGALPDILSTSIGSYGTVALIDDINFIEIDKSKSKINFTFVEEETSGTIEGLNLDINFNPFDLENASFKGTALVKTLDTDNFLRDGHLMWEKFFYKKKYPKIIFTSTQIVPFDEKMFKAIGNLTIKGIQKEVILTFTFDKDALSGKTTIYTSDFDVNIHDERAKNKLDIQFYFPFIP